MTERDVVRNGQSGSEESLLASNVVADFLDHVGRAPVRSSTRPLTKRAGMVMTSASTQTMRSFTPMERDENFDCKLDLGIGVSFK